MRNSRQKKQLIMRIGFAAEVLVFCWVYFLGPQGMRTVWHMRGENEQAQHSVGLLRGEVGELEQEVDRWQNSAFYKEKFAREQLQMARAGDMVYIRE
ncbi:septum formation initiator family protein [Methylicorpusculum sp.]|uniref:FtsB family cell division protein n=1 Tax=Methylicorpusculum sp. TaxID=2713644 RepID=UPI002ABB26F1|nr:septum formation initiator family protein [Methylicorpusculum sp.]MDZ4152002.1 septum formation initiator family protein [Methylicorpusculum sp.]